MGRAESGQIRGKKRKQRENGERERENNRSLIDVAKQMRTEKNKISNCQYEVEVMDVGGIETKPPQGEWMKHAPLRILSFDIECAGRKDHFPEAKIDPVIQIANVLSVQGQAHPVAKNVFTLDTCAPVVGAQIISCERERDLLVRWREFMIAVSVSVFCLALSRKVLMESSSGRSGCNCRLQHSKFRFPVSP